MSFSQTRSLSLHLGSGEYNSCSVAGDMPDFKLSAVLEGHGDDVRAPRPAPRDLGEVAWWCSRQLANIPVLLQVRAVAFLNSQTVLSASRDATVRLWKLVSSSPPTYDYTITVHGQSFINCLAYLPPTPAFPEFPEGLIFSSGQDTVIEARQPGKGADDNADAMLLGHAHNVCTLDVSPNGKWIVSGSWDGTARVWPVGKWEAEVHLNGHEGGVWAALAYDENTIITGMLVLNCRITIEQRALTNLQAVRTR